MNRIRPRSYLLQLLGISVLLLSVIAHGQSYDLLLKNGRVIDPKNKIDAKMDIAIKDGRVAKVPINFLKYYYNIMVQYIGCVLYNL